MKIYTGGGDRGKTSLFSGERVSKGDLRIEAYGVVDELNSILGALSASMPAEAADADRAVGQIQSDLFHVGAWLATTAGSSSTKMLKGLEKERAAFLEEAIDGMQAELPALEGFILPGGHRAAAWAHVARTVCRRAERRIVSLADREPSEAVSAVIVYINRLSDYLFVLARHINRVSGIDDVRWRP